MNCLPPTYSFRLDALAQDAALFRELTFPRLGKVLEAMKPPWIAVGAWNGLVPAGLALGHASAAGAALTSIFVAPELRRQGLGGRLLAAFEDEARARAAPRLQMRYAAATKMAGALAALLRQAGWEPPVVTEVSLIGEAGKMVPRVATWPGVKAWLDDPGSYSFEPWRPLSAADAEAYGRLLAQDKTFDVAPYVQKLDPQCSLQVRRSGVLVGWVVATPVQNAMLARYRDRVCRLYVCAFLDRNLWHTAVLVAGYYHAFSRQVAAYGEDTIANYHSIFPRMMAMTRRRFAPIALRLDEILSAEKAL
jgi:GNAT superfamily N-acetyltransferase